jgi:hypothetical protein
MASSSAANHLANQKNNNRQEGHNIREGHFFCTPDFSPFFTSRQKPGTTQTNTTSLLTLLHLPPLSLSTNTFSRISFSHVRRTHRRITLRSTSRRLIRLEGDGRAVSSSTPSMLWRHRECAHRRLFAVCVRRVMGFRVPDPPPPPSLQVTAVQSSMAGGSDPPPLVGVFIE